MAVFAWLLAILARFCDRRFVGLCSIIEDSFAGECQARTGQTEAWAFWRRNQSLTTSPTRLDRGLLCRCFAGRSLSVRCWPFRRAQRLSRQRNRQVRRSRKWRKRFLIAAWKDFLINTALLVTAARCRKRS